jgi:hypothetical protein
VSYLAKAKAVLTDFSDPTPSYWAEAPGMLGTTPNDNTRHSLMRLMVDWHERAAMMTCGDLTVEQAEIAAWHDLALDNVFWGIKQLH